MKKLITVLAIFIFSISLRFWNLNASGRTADEFPTVTEGFKYIELIKHGDFHNKYWKSIIDHPPLARYLYGLAAHFETIPTKDDSLLLPYDWQVTRFISILFSSLTVLLITFFGWKYFSYSIGIKAGIILAMLPVLLGLSQLVTMESILIFFFTASVYAYINFLQKQTIKNALITGCLLGLSLAVKFTNILLLPLFISIYVVWFVTVGKKQNKKIFTLPFILIFLFGLFIFIGVWPAMWFDPFGTLRNILQFRSDSSLPSELFFGRWVNVPLWYFIVYFFITTPLLIILLAIAGIKKVFIERNWLYFAVLLWFLIPFLQSFYFIKRDGIRYIIEIYSPLALLAAIGFDFLINKFMQENTYKLLAFSFTMIYLFLILINMSPYYLYYYNSLVGGPEGVYKNRTFMLDWWEAGEREAISLIAQAEPNGTTVGSKIIFDQCPPISGIQNYIYNEKSEYNYVLVSYLKELQDDHFNEQKIQNKYNLAYTVNAGGAPIMFIYKHK